MNWGPRNHERKLLIGQEHALHWIHWRISCSCVGKYGWKTVESSCNLVWFFDSVLWRELASLIEILAQGQMPGGWSILQLRSTLQGRLQLSFFRWLVVQLFYLPFFRRLAGGSTFVFMFFWQPHLSDLMATMSVHRTLSGGERLTLVNLITLKTSLIQITPNSVMQNLHWN